MEPTPTSEMGWGTRHCTGVSAWKLPRQAPLMESPGSCRSLAGSPVPWGEPESPGPHSWAVSMADPVHYWLAVPQAELISQPELAQQQLCQGRFPPCGQLSSWLVARRVPPPSLSFPSCVGRKLGLIAESPQLLPQWCLSEVLSSQSLFSFLSGLHQPRPRHHHAAARR